MTYDNWKLLSQLRLVFVPKYACIEPIKRLMHRTGEVGIVFPVCENSGELLVQDYEAELIAAMELGLSKAKIRYIEHQDLEAVRLDRLKREIGRRPNPLDTAAYISFVKVTHDLTDREIAMRLGISRSEITKFVAIDRRLSEDAKNLYRERINLFDRHRNANGFPLHYADAENIGKEHFFLLTQIRPHKGNNITSEMQSKLQAELVGRLCERSQPVEKLKATIREIIKTYKPKPVIVPRKYKSIIFAGDCASIFSTLGTDFADLIVTSPPYGFTKKKYDTANNVPELMDIIAPRLQLAALALKPGGHMFINIAHWRRDNDQQTFLFLGDLAFALWEVGMLLRDEITWHKGYLKNRDFNPKSQRHMNYTLMPNTEPIIHMIRGPRSRLLSKEESDEAKQSISEARKSYDGFINEWSERFRRCLYIQSSHKHAHESTKHLQGNVENAAMPDAMADWFIRAYSIRGDVVLDCFGGTGTTPKMAEVNDRRGIAFEINPSQIEILRQEGLVIRPIAENWEIPPLPNKWRELVRIKQEEGLYNLSLPQPGQDLNRLGEGSQLGNEFMENLTGTN